MARTDTLGHFLTDVADAIRTKGGTSATIQASNFDTAIANLPSGGGTTEVESKDVDFYDYDGTRIYSYTKTEFLALESMPSNPTHEGLTAQGWNWTLSDAKDGVNSYGKLDIGQYFVTDDGATRIYVNFDNEYRLNPYLCFGVNGTATIDWGDNTTSTATGTDLYTLVATQHTYTAPGKYVISISGGEIMFSTTSSGTNESMIFTMDSTTTSNLYDNIYINSIYKIEIGSNMTKIEGYAFGHLHSLETITTPTNLTSIPTGYVFAYCGALKYYLHPSITTLKSYMFMECRTLKKVVFAKETIEGGSNAFNNCMAIKRIVFNRMSLASSMFYNCYGVKEIIGINDGYQIQNSIFNNCRSLTKFVFLNNVTRLRTYVFGGCVSLKIIDLTICSAVPTLDSTNVFNYVPNDCKIIVPDSLYESWITASNWSNFASRIVKESDA